MSTSVREKRVPSMRRALLGVSILSCVCLARGPLEARASDLPDLSIDGFVAQNGGDFTDFFLELRAEEKLKAYFERYPMDDPAAWPELGRRFILNLAEVGDNLEEAESMVATKDRVGGLSGEVESAEKTRGKGRELRDLASERMALLKDSLKLIDQLRSILDGVAEQYAVTESIPIRSTSGQGFEGKILFIDGQDLIVSQEDGGFFRIPGERLGKSTLLAMGDAIFESWKPLEEVGPEDPDLAELNGGKLVAYDDDFLYLIDKFEGLVAEKRSESHFIFQPLEGQLGSGNGNGSEADTAALKAALERNSERLEKIEIVKNRFGVELPLSERQQASEERKAKLEEREKALEAERRPESEAGVKDEPVDVELEVSTSG